MLKVKGDWTIIISTLITKYVSSLKMSKTWDNKSVPKNNISSIRRDLMAVAAQHQAQCHVQCRSSIEICSKNEYLCILTSVLEFRNPRVIFNRSYSWPY